MNEAYQRQFMNGAPITARDCPAAVKAIYLRERKNLGSAKLARQTRADAAAAKRTRITVTGSSARAKLKATTGDCIRTQNQRFTRTNGRWLVGDITANTASLSCFGR